MNSIISFPGKIANIGSEIDYHGNAVTQEIRVMHGIIDSHGKGIETEMKMMHEIIDSRGKGIEDEMKAMRESFENEMRNMQKKTKQICITVLAVNVLTRIFVK
jgi:phage-related protein